MQQRMGIQATTEGEQVAAGQGICQKDIQQTFGIE
jgi:hypothetical protein